MSQQLKQGLASIVLTGLAGLVSTPLYAADEVLSNMTVQQRLERMERLLGADVLQAQAQQMDALQQEVSLLRGQIDQLDYELDTIKQRQRSLYLDMDRRLSNLEAGSGGGGEGSSGIAPPKTSARTSGLPVPVPTASSGGSSASAAADADGQEAYSKAFSLLKEGRYQQSITAFEDFLRQYPQSKYSDNAQYWLGEANYVSRDYKKALEEFQRLIARFPESTKIPGARLKIGYVYFELKNWSAARDSLQQVIKLYPEASVAKKAQERLDRIQREGH
jgi:tol-pal system protein YbgF